MKFLAIALCFISLQVFAQDSLYFNSGTVFSTTTYVPGWQRQIKEQDEVFPKLDTLKGVLVYHDAKLQIKADSAVLIRRADKLTIAPQQPSIYAVAVIQYIPDFYDWKLLISGKEIPLKNRITFHQ